MIPFDDVIMVCVNVPLQNRQLHDKLRPTNVTMMVVDYLSPSRHVIGAMYKLQQRSRWPEGGFTVTNMNHITIDTYVITTIK